MKNDIFNKIEEILINEKKPSIKLNEMLEKGEFSGTVFNDIAELKNTEQNLDFHPEGNVWNHTMMVVDKAAEVRDKSDDKKAFMMAAFLHDIGKTKTTVKRNGKWTSYDHDIVGAEMVKTILKQCDLDPDYIKRVSSLVRYHMHSLYINNDLPFYDIKGLLKAIEPEEVGLLCYCDRLGRGNMSEEDKKDIEKYIESFYNTVVNYSKL